MKRGQIRDFLLIAFLLIIAGLWYQPDITKVVLGNLLDFSRSVTGYFINWP